MTNKNRGKYEETIIWADDVLCIIATGMWMNGSNAGIRWYHWNKLDNMTRSTPKYA